MYTVYVCAHGRPYFITGDGLKWELDLEKTRWLTIYKSISRQKAVSAANVQSVRAVVTDRDCVIVYENGRPNHDNPNDIESVVVAP